MKIIEQLKFRKDFKRLISSGYRKEQRLSALKHALSTLATGKTLSAKYKNHVLIGEWSEFQECHLESDLLLIYKIDSQNETLELARIGTHSELFG